MKNLTGILPAYRKTTMDMSRALSEVLDFKLRPIGDRVTVNMRGQRNQAQYLPCTANDVFDWLLAVCPEWHVLMIGDYPFDAQPALTVPAGSDFVNEQFSVVTYCRSIMTGALSALLAHPQSIIQMQIAQSENSGGHQALQIAVIDEVGVLRLTLESKTAVTDIEDIEVLSDVLVTAQSNLQRMEFDPLQVAGIYHQQRSTHDTARVLSFSASCGRLTATHGSRPNIMPVFDAINSLCKRFAINCIEYGFNLNDQTELLSMVSEVIFTRIMEVSASMIEKPFDIEIQAEFYEPLTVGASAEIVGVEWLLSPTTNVE